MLLSRTETQESRALRSQCERMEESTEKLLREIDALGRHRLAQLVAQNETNSRLLRAAHRRVQEAVKKAADQKERYARNAAMEEIQRIQDKLQSDLEAIRDHCTKALELNDQKRDDELLRMRDAFYSTEETCLKEISDMLERAAKAVPPLENKT